MKTNEIIHPFPNFKKLAFLAFITLLFLQLSGKQKFPALIPMPQKVIWKDSNFKKECNKQRIIEKIVGKIPEAILHQDEAYRLQVNADSVVLTATTKMGLFRGRQTISQLTFLKNGEEYIAGCTIIDWPAFRVRGFMQDVGRNFMSVRLLKEQIDVMTAYKFNVFHFHVTDNPGWRLESKVYPQLSKATSMSRWPGKFYTQKEFTELVDYCNERYITLIPEFDVPGHCEAFRKAFALDSMRDPRVKNILIGLIDELCSLVPKEKMPWIHLGTDEVGRNYERPAPGMIEALMERVRSHQREVIVWRPGQQIASDHSSITQLWSSGGRAKEGHPFIDSRLNYLNHLDPLAGVAQLYFDRICNASHGDSLKLGGILCCWNDNNVRDEYDIIKQNPVYPGMLTYSETAWKGQPTDLGQEYLAKMPAPDSKLFLEFQDFENRLLLHRDLYFKGKPFPYVRQTQLVWEMTGPFDHKGELDKSFPVEHSDEKQIVIDGKTYQWTGPYYGGTIHIRHFFGYPSYFNEKSGTVYARTNVWSPTNQTVGCWIGFHDWSRSGGRRGGPSPEQGQWHNTHPKVWVNGVIIEPPHWQNPGLTANSEEIPFTDENYFFREPTKIILKKGWNQVLLKIPQGSASWKWMFTFVPVKLNGTNMGEIEGLRYSLNNF
ncbi:MAG: family 20 glycosylhydrolase [Prolixibacteraceae bacterium]